MVSRSSRRYAKTVFFPLLITKIDLFTKTGSGQTQGKLKHKTVFSQVGGLMVGAFEGPHAMMPEMVAARNSGKLHLHTPWHDDAVYLHTLLLWR
jgi:hypothetical protein